MPAYAYRAVTVAGRVTRGQISAVNENELAHYLTEAGLELIDAHEKTERMTRLSFGRGVSPRALAAFCTRMHDLLSSGIIFIGCLRDVTETVDNKILRDALMHVGRMVKNGGGIAASFALHPRLFSPVFTAIVGAGEKSGDMSVVFAYLARYAELRAQTQERLRRALRYPLFLFFVAGGSVSFMLVTVVPQVVQFLNGIQGALPLSTRMLVALSAAFSDYGEAVLIGASILVAATWIARHLSAGFAAFLDGFVLRLPFIGAVVTKTSLARFAHSFALLFRSGCDVPDSLRQARGAVSNRALQSGIERAEQRVLSGSSLSIALDGVLPAFAIGMLRTGERSGKLGKSLDDIATAYDREAQAATDGFIGVLEPALTLSIGALLAWTVLAVLGPLYGSLSVLGGHM